MSSPLFTKPKKAVGIDIGAHSVKAVQMSRSGGRLRIDHAGYALVDRNLINMDPIAAQAQALREALSSMPPIPRLLVGALPGQAVVIRYPRLPNMPESKIADVIEREASQHIPYDLAEVFLDWSVLETVTEGEQKLLKVLLVAAKHEVIESRVQIADAAELQYGVLSVDSLVLADAAESCGMFRPGETVALVNIGLTSASVHFVKDGVSNFIRDVNWGARELITAIARQRRCDYEQAERLLCNVGIKEEAKVQEAEILEEPSMEEVPPPPPPPSGASLLDPFEEEFAAPVEPVRPPTPQKAPPAADERPLNEIIEMPLSRLVAEIRRSFDYYEHELYESSIDRLILSGGVAHLPILSATLSEELGIRTVEVASPIETSLLIGRDRDVAPLRERPAQFMVAVGLAARGMADL